MTDMKRITVSFPDEIDERIFELKKTAEFAHCSYSEIIRRLVRMALDKGEDEPMQKGA